MDKKLQAAAPWLLLAATVLLWQLLCMAFDVSEFVFPSPLRIAQQAWEHHAAILSHAWRTFRLPKLDAGTSVPVASSRSFRSICIWPPMKPLDCSRKRSLLSGERVIVKDFSFGVPCWRVKVIWSGVTTRLGVR